MSFVAFNMKGNRYDKLTKTSSLFSLELIEYIYALEGIRQIKTMKTDSYQVAIVEDDSQASSQLKEMLLRFGGESFVSFEVDTYSDGLKFISSFHAQYDLVFLDIEMPYLNGMDAAKKIRETDKNVLIVFVTNLAQFALEGYEVQAFDFILKPITYPNLKMKLMRC